ncbi:hypothetical protein L1987_02199 [Smallanthus sonchifolius]|uniref:Uncharacterized protein n=1 Tax=Smallanthus sonchifolius TaxID=185202 RepID=A0ACB9K764_9ASTR|nr:hypothetical protein L1987_02199 [Smallanthus sonchifolius]
MVVLLWRRLSGCAGGDGGGGGGGGGGRGVVLYCPGPHHRVDGMQYDRRRVEARCLCPPVGGRERGKREHQDNLTFRSLMVMLRLCWRWRWPCRGVVLCWGSDGGAAAERRLKRESATHVEIGPGPHHRADGMQYDTWLPQSRGLFNI